jgi:two-component system, chemotaxis family, sensor kinase CheA
VAKITGRYVNEPMLDIFIFETVQNIEQLEQTILESEKLGCYSEDSINEIFRIMHTIKGSSAMMLFNNISSLAHCIEDLFYFLREQNPQNVDSSKLSDLVFEAIDFIKVELEKIKNNETSDEDASNLIKSIQEFLELLKQLNSIDSVERLRDEPSYKKQQYYVARDKSTDYIYNKKFKAVIYFEEGCEMENLRAYTITQDLKETTRELYHFPEDIIDSDDSINVIRKQGFTIFFKSDRSYQQIYEFLMQTVFLKDLELIELEDDKVFQNFNETKNVALNIDNNKAPKIDQGIDKQNEDKEVHSINSHQSIISVSVSKMDKLMDLMGEMVIAEAMVTQNPDLNGLELDNFQKAARQLRKITNEIQDMVMSIRMVPLSITFQKMHRIVRDMSKKLSKEVKLEIIGEETEVDKNIIEHISDPLMHIVRNSVDHGIEKTADRTASGKAQVGTVTLEAQNSGSDVIVTVKDDGKGLNKEKILTKAIENGLITKNHEELSDREIYNLIFLPGFSTKDKVTEFSGRGVGMDVVTKNIESVGGSVYVDSAEGIGTTITLKIPLTLAIIDGMNIRVGNSRYTIPITAIKESFKPKEKDVLRDPDGNEMIMVRGQCYPIVRLHEMYNVKTAITQFTDGIFVMAEYDEKFICIFADGLLGQQQVVVKALPSYIKSTKKVTGLAGCTLLGDGSISLILDIGGVINSRSA